MLCTVDLPHSFNRRLIDVSREGQNMQARVFRNQYFGHICRRRERGPGGQDLVSAINYYATRRVFFPCRIEYLSGLHDVENFSLRG